MFDQQLTHSAQILASVRNVDPDFPKNIRGDHEASPSACSLLPWHRGAPRGWGFRGQGEDRAWGA